ncbi:hypothetical protein ABXT70_01530 [Candidatus Njordibacter sp. Uisw_039]|jgi:hypothetical protein|uniref:hypothetical protein n=1 Tax=Candidatus Njordibacter sp. Uisw_039 TaxID=3230972 RepID=UPI003A1227D4|tara:strand:- start:5626 stop:6240 length:615 start_codon:yes stop_codon:yes gene_type:complete
MLSFIYLLLSASLIAFGVLLWRFKGLHDTHKTAALCLCLGAYACITNAPVFSLFIEPEMAILGVNLSLYVGVPMMALVLLDLAIGWQWKRATWGRIFLALAAMFELMRRAEAGNNYGKFILMACTLAVLFAIFRITKSAIPKGQAINKLYIMLGFYLGLMLASLWSFNTSFALLWNGLSLLAFGGYLYFFASAMALASPLVSPK